MRDEGARGRRAFGRLALAGLGLLGLAGLALLSGGPSQDRILKDSGISIAHSGHAGIIVFTLRIDGKERVVDRITYAVSGRDGQVEAEIVYLLDENEGTYIAEPRRRTAKDYVALWDKILKAGLEDLAALPLDEPVDPFEFIDSWRIDQDRLDMEFRRDGRRISFHLYDFDSYRDPRFVEIARLVMDFLEKGEKLR